VRQEASKEERNDHYSRGKTALEGRGFLEELIRITSCLTQYAALHLARERLIERSARACPEGRVVLFYDQGFQFTGIEYFEVGKNASRVIHRGEYTAVVLQLD
jgi:hypothetical protein